MGGNILMSTMQKKGVFLVIINKWVSDNAKTIVYLFQYLFYTNLEGKLLKMT